MTQTDRELLMKDLSARIPYGVKYMRYSWDCEWDQEIAVIETLEDIDNKGYINRTGVYRVDDIKPYLRPLSDMTDTEYKEFSSIRSLLNDDRNGVCIASCKHDWLVAHHFDFNGLIEKGLALAACELTYKKK